MTTSERHFLKFDSIVILWTWRLAHLLPLIGIWFDSACDRRQPGNVRRAKRAHDRGLTNDSGLCNPR